MNIVGPVLCLEIEFQNVRAESLKHLVDTLPVPQLPAKAPPFWIYARFSVQAAKQVGTMSECA